ncbi:MAG: hypothetical protein HRT57_12880 [Crocinitomicaceae bacterium]|nr:hypothetical protein [Crocinitomicaceae bacterium]
MKGITFLVVLFMGFVVMAQPSNVVSSKVYLESGELDKAKKAADAAVIHSETSIWAKAWKYRGDIYYSIYNSKDEKYHSLSNNPLPVVFDSYRKVKELDKSGEFKDDTKEKLEFVNAYSLNNGVEYFNEKQYEKARTLFLLSNEAAAELGIFDSLANYNIALASERLEDHKTAIKYFKACAENGYREARMYYFILSEYNQLGDEETYIIELNKYLEKFPMNQDLLSLKLNSHLKRGENNEALIYIDRMLVNDPNNGVYHFSKGSILDGLQRYGKAEVAYKKALSIDSYHFNANYNLGALYFNKGVELSNQANEQSTDEEYNKLKKIADLEFKNALPYLEKAYEIDSNHRGTLISLKQLYARFGMTEKYEEVKAKLNN